MISLPCMQRYFEKPTKWMSPATLKMTDKPWSYRRDRESFQRASSMDMGRTMSSTEIVPIDKKWYTDPRHTAHPQPL